MSFIDARRHTRDSEVRADVCVIGAGAAGLAIARELAGSGATIALLDSGALAFHHRAQFLNIGESSGLPSFPLTHSRFRQFGGSMTRWAGQCRPLDELDFAVRDGIPDSGWPFGSVHLRPYYGRAHVLLDAGDHDYRPAALGASIDGLLPMASDRVETRVYRFCAPRALIDGAARELQVARDVQVHLQATATGLRLERGGARVSCCEAAALGGHRFRVRAGTFVLACGGIENARLLLASDRDRPGGIGNHADLLGRCFMDHPYFLLGSFDPSMPAHDRTPYVIEDYASAGTVQRVHAAFGLAQEVLRREGLNNAAVFFVRRPGYKTAPEYFSPGMLSAQHLADVLRHSTVPDRRLPRHLWNILRGAGDIALTLRRLVRERFVPDRRLGLRAVVEATPCRDSRVTLSEARDAFGRPRARVHWQLNASDRHGLERLIWHLREEFERLGLGRIRDDVQAVRSGWPASMSGGKHHMGTTRMHADPARGVVDPNCRVHGIDNLYVAGSSVFPTGGYANPTLTIVALAIRLADHLAGRCAQPGETLVSPVRHRAGD